MKFYSSISFVRPRSGGTFIRLVATGVFISPVVRAATYQQTVYPIYNVSDPLVINEGSTGYTSVAPAGTEAGDILVTANGLVLSYATVGTGERPIISNAGAVTGAGIQMDRYLSFSLGPDNIDALAGYSGGYTVNLVSITRPISLETGAHFEIRTSLDNFANPLVQWVDFSTGRLDPVAPGLTTSGTTLINGNGTVASANAPIEFRMYTWYDQAGVTGYIGDNIDLIRFVYQVETIPEPSSLLLLGAAGAIPLLRRRRCDPASRR